MISNQKWMLHGALSLAVVLSAAEVHAQKLETPGAPTAETASSPSSSGPASFGDAGQFVLSAERLFGYNWDRESRGTQTLTSSTFSLLGNPFSVGAYPYDWPRLGFDYFLIKSVSAGAGIAFARTTSGNSSINSFEVAPRLGYGTMIGPWLGIWPRVGVTYVYSTNQNYLGITIDLAAVITVASHLAITVAPVANIGVAGTRLNVIDKITTIGAQFGLAIPF